MMHPDFIGVCVFLWSMGFDTRAMAALTLRPEAYCATALRLGREVAA